MEFDWQTVAALAVVTITTLLFAHRCRKTSSGCGSCGTKPCDRDP